MNNEAICDTLECEEDATIFNGDALEFQCEDHRPIVSAVSSDYQRIGAWGTAPPVETDDPNA